MEFSNKTLAWIVVATIVVSMAGTMVSLNKISTGFTGYATSNTTGNVSVTVSTSTVLQFVSSALSLGTGEVVVTSNNCSLYIDNTTRASGTYNISRANWADCEGFSNTTLDGTLILENAGNTKLNVTINFTADATTFIGGGQSGSLPYFSFRIFQNETASCPIMRYNVTGNWTNASFDPGRNYSVCTDLSWTNINDSIGIGIYVSIPVDASGSKNVSIIAQGTG